MIAGMINRFVRRDRRSRLLLLLGAMHMGSIMRMDAVSYILIFRWRRRGCWVAVGRLVLYNYLLIALFTIYANEYLHLLFVYVSVYSIS